MVIHNIKEKKRGLDQLCFPQIEDEVEITITEGKVPYTLTIDVCLRASSIQKNKTADVHSTSSSDLVLALR